MKSFMYLLDISNLYWLAGLTLTKKPNHVYKAKNIFWNACCNFMNDLWHSF